MLLIIILKNPVYLWSKSFDILNICTKFTKNKGSLCDVTAYKNKKNYVNFENIYDFHYSLQLINYSPDLFCLDLYIFLNTQL